MNMSLGRQTEVALKSNQTGHRPWKTSDRPQSGESMSDFILDERVRLSIELALTADRADPRRQSQQEDAARKLGMTGAEIDVARHGSSFDALTSIAVALAIASRDADRAALADVRHQAVKAGISEEVCRQIAAYAADDHRERSGSGR
jgi:hypothetical protein